MKDRQDLERQAAPETPIEEAQADAPEPQTVPGTARVSAPAATALPYVRNPSAVRSTAAGAAVASQAPVRARLARIPATDYGYVVGELKRIGATVGSLVVLLLILSRFIH